jgi:hypothetical protein
MYSLNWGRVPKSIIITKTIFVIFLVLSLLLISSVNIVYAIGPEFRTERFSDHEFDTFDKQDIINQDQIKENSIIKEERLNGQDPGISDKVIEEIDEQNFPNSNDNTFEHSMKINDLLHSLDEATSSLDSLLKEQSWQSGANFGNLVFKPIMDKIGVSQLILDIISLY